MRKYKLLKDLPYVKAGTIFERHPEEPVLIYKNHRLHLLDINTDEWSEEVKEIKKIDLAEHFFIILGGRVDIIKFINYTYSDETEQEYIKKKEECKSVGNFFETREEAEKYLEYLKAKEVIKKDTKGFNPNWEDKDEDRFMGCWDFKRKRARFDYGDAFKTPEIYFKSREDISESFEKHPEEWKTYLTYEQ